MIHSHKYIEDGIWRYKCLGCGKMIKSHYALEFYLDCGIYDDRITEAQKTGYLREYLSLGSISHTGVPEVPVEA